MVACQVFEKICYIHSQIRIATAHEQVEKGKFADKNISVHSYKEVIYSTMFTQDYQFQILGAEFQTLPHQIPKMLCTQLN